MRSNKIFKAVRLGTAVSLALGLIGGAVAKPNPHPVNSLEYGEVLFEYYQDHHFDALSQYFYAGDLGVLKDQGTEATLVSGGINVGMTMPSHAVKIFEDLLQYAKDDATRQQAWYHLASLYYNLGDYERASKAIDNVGEALPELYKQRYYSLYVNVKSRFQPAASLLDTLDKMNSEPGPKAYAVYNMGVARHRDQEPLDQTVEQFLDTIKVAPNNEAGKSLIDKVHLTIAKLYAEQGIFDKSLESYQKVRVDGSYGRDALLGYGWTLAKMGDYEKALSPWSALSKEGLEDPRVLEAKLAIPYSLEKLGASGQALDYYRSADVKFSEAITDIDALSAELNQEDKIFLDVLLANQPKDVFGWQAEINFALNKGDISPLLTDYMASKTFQKLFSNYRDLFYLKRNLELWQKKVALYQLKSTDLNVLSSQDQVAFALAQEQQRVPKFQAELARKQVEVEAQLKQLNEAISTQRAGLVGQTQNYLESMKMRIAYYQSQGRLSIARLFDQAEQKTAQSVTPSTSESAGE